PPIEHANHDALEADVRARRVRRLRVVGHASDAILALAAAHDVDVVTDPVLRAPRAELRFGQRARSIAVTTHRHGMPSRQPFLGHATGASTGASRSTSKPTGTTPEGLMVGWLR